MILVVIDSLWRTVRLVVQVEALEVERRTLEGALESSRDELGDANNLVGQLRLENTRKVRRRIHQTIKNRERCSGTVKAVGKSCFPSFQVVTPARNARVNSAAWRRYCCCWV